MHYTPPNPLTVKYSSITVSQLLPGIPVELTNTPLHTSASSFSYLFHLDQRRPSFGGLNAKPHSFPTGLQQIARIGHTAQVS